MSLRLVCIIGWLSPVSLYLQNWHIACVKARIAEATGGAAGVTVSQLSGVLVACLLRAMLSRSYPHAKQGPAGASLCKCLIPNEYVGPFIGRGGSEIRALGSATNAIIKARLFTLCAHACDVPSRLCLLTMRSSHWPDIAARCHAYWKSRAHNHVLRRLAGCAGHKM